MADETLETFKEVTGCSNDEEAKHMLDACKDDLQRAVDLYFTRAHNAPNGHAQPGPSDRDVVAVDDDVAMIPDDELAAAMAEDDGVRAPLRPVQGPIVEQSFDQAMHHWQRRAAAAPTSVFDQYRSFRQIADEQRAEAGRGAGVSASNGQHEQPVDPLVSLFRPPVDLIYNDHWDGTRAHAEELGRWLLVNVQKSDEFACQTMNRDVWADPTVKDIVRSNFIFWQVPDNSPDGERVCGYYKLMRFPAIFIVDPRTGEQVHTLKPLDPTTFLNEGTRELGPVAFLDQLTSFLHDFPTFKARDSALHGDPTATAVEAKTPPPSNAVTDAGNEKEKQEPMSVGQDEWKDAVPSPDAATKEISLVLRLPNGRRETLKLPDNCPLKAIMMFVAGLGFTASEHLLLLNFPKREFSSNDADRTLREVGFTQRELVHVERK